ncbi:hypothetical protein L345_15723, partial [Ophiophagus hannah]
MPCEADSQQRLDCSQHIWNMTFSAEGAVSIQISPDPSALSCHSEEEGSDKKFICDYKPAESRVDPEIWLVLFLGSKETVQRPKT